MNVNIVCSDEGWIYDKFIDELRKNSKHNILRNSADPCDITHYLPYYEVPEKVSFPASAFMSHQESKNPLKKKFVTSARSVDIAISMSAKYANILRGQGVSNVVQIITGVDLNVFQMRGRRANRDKLIAGYVGRKYTSSRRKNPKLLEKISKLPFVELYVTDGKLAPSEVPAFYKALDVVVSPATIEGGPMAIQEGLAVGVPIICLKGVGLAEEFPFGVLQANSSWHFLRILKQMYLSEDHIHYWNDIEIMRKMRSQVENQSWKLFAEKHDRAWDSICAKL